MRVVSKRECTVCVSSEEEDRDNVLGEADFRRLRKLRKLMFFQIPKFPKFPIFLNSIFRKSGDSDNSTKSPFSKGDLEGLYI